MRRAGTKKIYIGLKWKAVIYLSLVLLILNGGFFSFNFFSTRQQAEHQREAKRLQYREEVRRHFDLTSDRLQRLAELLPSLSGIHTSLADSDKTALQQAFEPHWQSLNVDMDIYTVGFYDRHAQPLGQWFSIPLEHSIVDKLHAQVQEVLSTEIPLTYTYCAASCIQISAIPILSDTGSIVGSVVLGRSTAYLLLDLYTVSGVDIGLLSPKTQPSETSLGTWQLKLLAMTHRDRFEPLLQQLAAGHAPPGGEMSTWTQRSGKASFEINIFPLMPETSNGPLAILVIDITKLVAQVEHANYTNALIAVIGLLVSELLLLLSLWRPTSRIKETVELLPLLAEHAFAQVHQQVSTHTAHWIEDETDVLRNTADDLADQLETLQTEVEDSHRELRLSHDLLQERVDEQTADLKAAKEAAVSANLAKSEFLANMSHELRTPMHAILSYAELGEEKSDSAPRDKLLLYFGRIRDSGDRLLNLLNDLLDLSKLEAGRMQISARQNDLRTVVELASVEFAALLHERSLRLEVLDSQLDTLGHFDRDKILQVVCNLLSNAIKFTPAGKTIHVRFGNEKPLPPTAQAQDGLPFLSLSIADEGIGIPQEEQESVFDKFVQSSKTRSGAGGTGLGLAICKEIVELHGGRIWAADSPAGGALFTFSIPALANAAGG